MKSMLFGLIALLGAAGAPDGDGDGIADAEDRCPYFASAEQQADTNGDGVGDACQCGDANGDGRLDVSDIVAVGQMTSGETEVSPLCDANGSGNCESGDVDAINQAIFGSCFAVCSRYPKPPEGKTACGAAAP